MPDSRDPNLAPPKLLDCEASLLSFDPLVGIITLITEGGQIEVAVNRAAATMLAGVLVELLGAEPEEGNETN